jgi:hypothetical protein
MSEMLKEKALSDIPDVEFCIFDSEDDYPDDVPSDPEGPLISRNSIERGHSVGLIEGNALQSLSRQYQPAEMTHRKLESNSPSVVIVDILFNW